MKGRDIIQHIVRTEMPDREQTRANCVRQSEEETVRGRGLRLNRVIPAAACAVLILAAAVAFPYLNRGGTVPGGSGLPVAQSPSDSDRPDNPTTTGGSSALLTSDPSSAKIALNELAAPLEGGYALFALMTDDFIPMDQQGLLDFYGVNLFPSGLSDELPLSEFQNDYWGIYRREKGTGEVYWAQNTVRYGPAPGPYTESALYVTVAPDKVFSQVGEPFGEGAVSEINGTQVLIGHYSQPADGTSFVGDLNYFYASFQYGGVDFLVTGVNISQTEFVDAVISLLA
jgi:hypothetical protein